MILRTQFNKKIESLKKKEEIDKIFKNGSVIKAQNYICRYIKNYNDHNRLCVIVKKYIGNAAIRNYEKRLVREFIQKKICILTHDYDLIIFVLKRNNTFIQKREDFLEILEKIQRNGKE
jgi:ribonuclease P protein component